MRAPPGSGDAQASRNTPITPARRLEALHQGFRTRLKPLLEEARAAAERELRAADPDARTSEQVEALANAVVLGHESLRHERIWQEHLARGFAGWPRPAASARQQAFSLVSEGELHAQLIGQPAIEALERRCANVLDIIDGRLWSLGASFGSQERPLNPFGPRAVIDAFLDTYSATECDRVLRPVLLRHYEKLCGVRLPEIYAWLNAELAEGGFAMDGASAGTTLVSQPVAGGQQGAWPGHDALQPQRSSWRNAGDEDASRERVRRRALRERLRRPGAGSGHTATRDLSEQEFVSVLSLLQGNETPAQPVSVPGAIGEHMRRALRDAADGLGLPPDLAAPSARQEDAIDAVGALVDGLRSGAVLSEAASARLARLAWPWLRLALDDADLFDEPDHTAMRVLSSLVECWDANPAETSEEAELHALADQVADHVANEYHGDASVFDAALRTLESGRTRLMRRSDISARRAWQAILGGERLQAARCDADAALRTRLEGRRLPAEVAGFLSGPWRQALVLACLRDGPDSARYAGLLALGDALLRIDEAAAASRGNEVADGLIALAPELRECQLAGGEDAHGADDVLARLVAALARPDTPRLPAEFVPLADEDQEECEPPGQRKSTATPDRVLVDTAGGGPGSARWLRLAWTSPLTGRHLLVNRQGAREALMSDAALEAAIHSGGLALRPDTGPVEAVLRQLTGHAPG